MENKSRHTSVVPEDLTFRFLEDITDHFSEERKVGSGALGVVYKGLLGTGEEIAVKKLCYMPGVDNEQFKNEFKSLMRVQHKNIVRLVAYCYEVRHKHLEYNGEYIFAGVEERALCFEYLHGGGLDNHLSDESCGLDWNTRYQIIKGVSEGLHYLHTGYKDAIYHLNLKPSNILLDNNMIPKIGDFGLSRIFGSAATYTGNSFIGTFRYMPPEYISKGQISSKFDVFSLGVIIIEIMTGPLGYSQYADMRASQDFIEHVHRNWEKRLQLMPWPTTGSAEAHQLQEVKTCMEIALRCVEFYRTKRPTTTEIVNELNKLDTTRRSLLGQLGTSAAEDLDVSIQGAIKQSGAEPQERDGNITVLEEAPISTSSNIGTLLDGSSRALPGAMRPLVDKLEKFLLAPPQGCSSESVKDEMQLLKEDVEEMSSYLDELSEVEEPPPTAKCWMNEAHDLSYDIEDYIDNLLFVQPADPSRLSNNIKSTRPRLKLPGHGKTSKRLMRHQEIAGTVSQFRMFVQKAIERHQRYDLHYCGTLRHRFVSVGPMLPTHYGETADNTVIDDRMNKFINSLTNDEGKQIKVISVLGFACLGKSTLARVLYSKVGDQYHCRAFIRVSKQPDTNRIFRDILSQLQGQPPIQGCKEIDLIDNIKAYLQDKRCLIILDDVWDVSVWDIINRAFPKGNHGSRIIMATQIEDVALTCCCYQSEHVFRMRPLDDDHSRKLFFNTLFGSESNCPEQFKGDLNKIVQICGGLPLATISIARLLASQPAMTKDLLKHIHESLSSHFSEKPTSERTRQALNLSFNNLPRYLKSCLLYLSMYSEGYEFFKYDLVKQWVAEGLIDTIEGQDIEKVAESYLDQLICRGFIEPKCVSYNNVVVSFAVHDVIHDLLVNKSAEESFIMAIDHHRKNVSLSHMVRRLSLIFGDARYAKTPANISKPQIRSLRFSGLFECMPCIRDFKLLRVLNLHLSGNPVNHDSMDLTGISELFLLRYLKIASDVCIKLPKRMRGLQCLETLDVMDATRDTAVPWDIIHLPHLLHLILPVERNLLDWIDSMGDCVISLWSLGKLNKLQDLHLTSSSALVFSDHPERSMEALGSLLGGHGNLKTLALTHDHGSCHKDGSRVIICWDVFAPPPLLERFEFSPHSCIIFSRTPRWVKELSNLCILNITVREVLMNCVDILGGLPALNALSLYVETAAVDELVFDNVGFSVLKYFKFRSNAPWLTFKAGAMPNLVKLMLGFNVVHRMDQHRQANAVITIEHMRGLKVISAKIGGASANTDAISALETVVSSHLSNPTINVQLVDYTLYYEESSKQKQQADEIVP